MFKTVLFDLDGTLLDTLEDLAGSVNYALTCHALPTRSLEEVRTFVGSGVGMLVRRALPEDADEALEQSCLATFKAHYHLNMHDRTAPYPGVLPLLETLRDKGTAVGVLSNKYDGAVKELCAEHFSGLTHAAIGEGNGVAKKPDPSGLRRAMAELGAEASTTVYVGDSDVDLKTARNAGVPCIAVTWGFRDRAFLACHGAEIFADTPEELLELLLKT